MNLSFTDIRPATGEHVAGICSLYVVPRQWINTDPVIDFETGKVLTAVDLKENTFWIRIDLLQPSYEFTETPKDSKSGDYKEIALTGTLNFYNYILQQQLETLRRCQLVVLLTDMNKRRRLIGDSSAGMLFKYAHSVHKEEAVQINMMMESEDPAPFYNPDNEPEIIYNLLENVDGNFLLVE